MAAIIQTQIEEQNFEIILNKIGIILLEEIQNQLTITSSDVSCDVYKERQEPIDKSEDVLVNVSLSSTNNEDFNETSYTSTGTFNIDVYANGFGSDYSRLRLHKIVGMIRFVLSSTLYKTLGFDYGYIMGTYLTSINFDDNYGKEDGTFFRMGRLVLSVKFVEDSEMAQTTSLLGNDSNVRLDLTEKGFKFNFNN